MSKNEKGLFEACRNGSSLEELQEMLQQYPEAVKDTDDLGMTPLHQACRCGLSLEIIQCLVRAWPESVQVAAKDGRLPLHVSCMNQPLLAVVEFLIKASPESVNALDFNRKLPLHAACQNSASLDVIRELLYHGRLRCVAMKDSDGKVPSDYGVQSKELRSCLQQREGYLRNASASFLDVEPNGPPTKPLDLTDPLLVLKRAERVDAPVKNPETMEIKTMKNVIYERQDSVPDHGYWVGERVKRTIFGVIKKCTILDFLGDDDAPWELTRNKAIVQIYVKETLERKGQTRNALHEVAIALRSGRALKVLEDDLYILVFLPACSDDDLYSHLQESNKFSEPMARHWFQQLLKVSYHSLMCGSLT